jgi:hypothetical protein
MIKEFLVEDFLLSWEDNLNKLLKIGLVLDMYQKCLKQTTIKIIKEKVKEKANNRIKKML